MRTFFKLTALCVVLVLVVCITSPSQALDKTDAVSELSKISASQARAAMAAGSAWYGPFPSNQQARACADWYFDHFPEVQNATVQGLYVT